jgi:hypothetical protein
MAVPERISSKTGKAVLLVDEGNHDEENMPGPKGFDRPVVDGSVVNEPERSRLVRSDNTDEATGEATEAEWRNVGRIGAGGVALDCGKRCSCSLKDSVDVRVLGLGVLEAANCWAASDTLEGKVPALALL